jgi:hypothetical protein
MPTRTLTTIDLTDHAPPVPGERERAAVRVRAAQITRRRRLTLGAGLLGIAVIVAGLSAVAFTGGGSGTAHVTASIHVVQSGSTPVEAGSTVTVDLKNADGTFSGQADDSGTVQFAEDIAPGSYSVLVTVDSAPVPPTNEVDIGPARVTYRSFDMTLVSGVNTLDLSILTPAN